MLNKSYEGVLHLKISQASIQKNSLLQIMQSPGKEPIKISQELN